MLHAILHRKLGLLTPDAQRLEDAVTSTVFGTLALVERWDVLARWLAGSVEDGIAVGYSMWFWPTLRTAQCTAIPDVCVRIGDRLFVVEAKYGSGRHDLAADIEIPEQVLDQLVRQHVCISASAPDRIAYSDGIQRSLDECKVEQVFLVDARRIRRARAELKQSVEREPRMRISLVTWQQLDRQLYEQCASERWAADLREFLELEGLNAFVGFGRVISAPPTALLRWGGQNTAVMRLREAIEPARHGEIDRIRRWRAGSANRARQRRWSQITPAVLPHCRSVKRWCSVQSKNRSTHGGN